MSTKTTTIEAKATVTDTDLGQLRLLVSTYEKDRGGDMIQPGSWAKTIKAWRESGKKVPLHFEHRADEIIGSADPATMEETSLGLECDAQLDLEVPRAKEVMRAIKNGVMSASFGYMAESHKLDDSTRLITSVDLIEVTLTASPMAPGAGVLAYKGTGGPALSESGKPLDSGEPVPWPSLAEFNAQQATKAQEAETKRLAKPIQVATFGVDG